MRLIVHLLLNICKLSMRFPGTVMVFFVGLAVVGFSAMPLIKISSNPMAGIGSGSPLIKLSQENNEIFGEQDSLILVLEFAESPGEERAAFIGELSDSLEAIPGVRRVRYRFLDTENLEQVTLLFKHFLLGMNQRERDEIEKIFTDGGIQAAFRRTVNRLFLSGHPYIQQRLLADPIELGQFVAESMHKRVGSISLGDLYLLIASPDSTVYLIQITPDFPSADLVRGKKLIEKLETTIPDKITGLLQAMPALSEKAKGLKWQLTGKTVFHHESDQIFEKETLVIFFFSFGMVTVLLIVVYRSLLSGALFMVPILAGIGPNYGLIWLCYDEVNPVVMGAAGVLFGLGTDYGVHLWGRLREEIDRGVPMLDAVNTVYEQTGPPVMLGALVGILAFLCMCLSRQPAMAQFGYVGAAGLALTLVSTLFLFPALVKILSRFKKDYVPRMRVSFRLFSNLFQKRPGTIVAVSAVVIVISLVFATRVTYEKELFKVFLASNMNSMQVSDMISRKFHSNFSQPSLLSFDVDDVEEGLTVQRRLDGILEKLMGKHGEIASFDSISYLMSPESVRTKNIHVLEKIANSWPQLTETFNRRLEGSMLSRQAAEAMQRSVAATGEMIRSAGERSFNQSEQDLTELERSWYMTKINGKYRFLTKIRYSSRITDMEKLKATDERILQAVQTLPVKVSISGPRQVMEEILSSLVSELLRLGLYVLAATVIFFFALFGHPLAVLLSLIPMTGAFVITMGLTGALGMGLPFSIVGVAPLIFGLGMDNGVHVVMGAFKQEGSSITDTMAHVTRPIIFTSATNVLGFLAMLTSNLYSLQFLGWCVVVGMTAAVALTLTTLPAILLLLERRKSQGSLPHGAADSRW